MKSRILCPSDHELLSAIWKAKNQSQQCAAIWRYLRVVNPSSIRYDDAARQIECESALQAILTYASIRSSRRLTKTEVWKFVSEYLLWKTSKEKEDLLAGKSSSVEMLNKAGSNE